MQYPLGIFDSGIGGLTVLKALKAKMPYQNFIYVGDTARYPYGRKSRAMIIKFSLEIAHFLVQKNVVGIVVACNTASALALPALQQHCSVPIWGVLEPGVEAASRSTKTGQVGLIATASTIASGIYQDLLAKKNLNVWAHACPMLVHLVEEGLCQSQEAELLIRYYLASCPSIDTLILGCTHYPWLKSTFQTVIGSTVHLVDSAQVVSDVVSKQYKKTPSDHLGRIVHYVTGDPFVYEHTARSIVSDDLLGDKIEKFHG